MPDFITVTAIVLAGAVWRRWFGGWRGGEPVRAVRFIVGIALCLTAATVGSGHVVQTMLAGLIVAASFTPGHGSYMDMGLNTTDTDNEFLRPFLRAVLPARLWDTAVYDFIGMALRYSIFTVPAGFVMGQWEYMLAGVVIALSYLVLSRVNLKLPTTERGFLDGYTAYCELLMGFLLIGGLALPHGRLLFGWLDPIILTLGTAFK